MIDLRFVFFFLITFSIYDALRMAYSDLIYWGYGESGKGTYDAEASENAELSMFGLCYYIAIVSAVVLHLVGYYTIETAIYSVLAFAWLHWTGSEDLGYYIALLFIKNPKKYEESHVFVTICGVQIPVSLYWLSKPRVVGFISIPSIISFVCGKEVPAKIFTAFAVLNIEIIVVLSFI